MENKYQEILNKLSFFNGSGSYDVGKSEDVRKKNIESRKKDFATIQELVDKEEPMKVGDPQSVVNREDIQNGYIHNYLCPKCHRVVAPFHISIYTKTTYCEFCGQKLDWSNDND